MKVVDFIEHAELMHCHAGSLLTLSSVTIGRTQVYFVIYMKCQKNGAKKNASYCRTWAGLMTPKIAQEH